MRRAHAALAFAVLAFAVLAFAVLAVLALAPGSAGAQMITANPCSLLTTREVQAATRDTVTVAPVLSQFQIPECAIATAPPGGGPSNGVVKIRIESTRDYDDLFWAAATTDRQPIPGLGDRAVIMGIPPVVKVLHRGHVYTISYENATLQPDEIKTRERALAAFAIARAP